MSDIKVVGTYYRRIKKGGAERVVVELISIWKKMGYQVVLFTEEPESEDDYEITYGVEKVFLQSNRQTNTTNYYFRGQQIEDALNKFHIDVMVYQEWMLAILELDMQICKRNDVKFLIYCHSIFSLLLKSGKPRLKECGEIFAHADGLITLNEMDTKYWSNFNNNVWQVLNPTFLKWKKIDFHKEFNNKILWVGRLTDVKAPMDVLNVAKKVSEYDKNIVIYMLGESERQEFTEKIYSECKKMGIEGNIKLELYHRDVIPFLEKCSMFMMTSQLESFSLALQETQCYGMPCIMYELPYLTLTQNKAGIIEVPQGDTNQMAQQIISLSKNKDLYESMNKGARENFVSLYDNLSIEKSWQQIFDKLNCEIDIEKKIECNMKYIVNEMNTSYCDCMDILEKNRVFPQKMIVNMLTREIVLFGTGKRAQSVLREYPEIKVSFFIDNANDKQNERFHEYVIKHPKQITDWKKIFIIIAVVDYERIKMQLEGIGLVYREDFVLQKDILEI